MSVGVSDRGTSREDEPSIGSEADAASCCFSDGSLPITAPSRAGEEVDPAPHGAISTAMASTGRRRPFRGLSQDGEAADYQAQHEREQAPGFLVPRDL